MDNVEPEARLRLDPQISHNSGKLCRSRGLFEDLGTAFAITRGAVRGQDAQRPSLKHLVDSHVMETHHYARRAQRSWTRTATMDRTMTQSSQQIAVCPHSLRGKLPRGGRTIALRSYECSAMSNGFAGLLEDPV